MPDEPVDWSAIVQAEPHDEGCGERSMEGGSPDYELFEYEGPCNCTRDARVGRKVAAVAELYAELEWAELGVPRSEAMEEAARIFREAS